MSNLKLKPLADRVLVEPMEAEERNRKRNYYPRYRKGKTTERHSQSSRLPGTKDVTMEVKVGDVVLYGKYAGTEISIDDKEYLMMKQADILAIV